MRFGSNPVDSVNTRVNSGQQKSTEVKDGQLKDQEYCRTQASKSSLGNDITKSYIASFALEYSGCISEIMARLE
ncbi:hypothetical protein HanXRQr2_Chr17g0809611 [Helianthus annuus]|uniref:Uncharacterized protein n=1 Tax=Helianthus annuus TaxID=4232 RepID=A0A251RUZ6_HELAN|nr:hypothetical protein HanXRQr2_Chr17g0809611 [Helianthus annuus]